MREPVTKAFRRAGCGKSARPVRRGDGVSPIRSAALRPTLLASNCWYANQVSDILWYPELHEQIANPRTGNPHPADSQNSGARTAHRLGYFAAPPPDVQ